MSYADDVFIRMCKDIIENGTSTEGEKVRPKWEDGSFAYTWEDYAAGQAARLPGRMIGMTAICAAFIGFVWLGLRGARRR